MRKLESLIAIVEEFLPRLSSFNWLAALLMRLFVGYFFFETGWAKVHNLDAFTQRFMQWGIPHPAFNAALSAYTECIGGALTVVGLGMRFVSIPMMINMAVAIITVKLKNVAGLDDFVELDEPLYALVYFWLMISGAGWISIDNLIRKTLEAALRNDKSPGLSSATSSAAVSTAVNFQTVTRFSNQNRERKDSMKYNRITAIVTLAIALACSSTSPASAQLKPGDLITRDNASKVAGLVSPGNMFLVQQGMTMRIVPTGQLDWPPPYKAATEKYSSQVGLSRDGNLANYVAGLPFPMVDADDPQAASKIMWNFEFRPMYTDDVDARNVETKSYAAGSSDEIEHFAFGHFGLYNYIGRTEVAPVPIDPGVLNMGIASRGGVYPVLEPAEMRGAGIVRERSVLPKVEDYAWEYSSSSRRLRRLPASELSDAFGVARISGAGTRSGGGGATTYASTLDPNSAFGFSGKITEYSYRLLGERSMLASVDGNSPATPCANDGGRTVCENWQPRRIYVIEATAKPGSALSASTLIPKRILYIDSEGWFITASDLYDRDGRLWKTIADFYAYSDRATRAATVSIWPFKRIFQTAMVDQDLTTGFSSVVYTPGLEARNSLYINMGAIDWSFFTPEKMVQAGH